jgi:glucose/arabinose dehydrogenase
MVHSPTQFSVMASLFPFKFFTILALTSALLLSPSLAQTTCATVSPKYAPVVAAGYNAKVLMNGLKTPRGMLFDSQGNLLIVEQGGAGVRLVKLTDGDGTNVCVASSKQLIADSSVCEFHKFCEAWKRPVKAKELVDQRFMVTDRSRLWLKTIAEEEDLRCILQEFLF